MSHPEFHKRTVSSTHSEAKGSESQIENFAPAKYEHDYSEDIYLTRYPNRWSKYREMIREPFAEFLGVAVLILFGTGVVCQVTLSSSTAVAPSPKGEYLSINFGWAVGTAMGVWVSGGVSGGHINPAITIALATYRGFPWKKVPIYIFAQFLGGIAGAAIVYANYFHAIDIFEGGRGIRTLTTAALFTSYPLDYMTNVSCFFSEFISSVILLIGVLAMNDRNNLAVPAGLPPLFIFFLILGIGVSLGMETGYSINPARDLGPRILTSVVGCGKVVFTFRNQYWLWCLAIPPIMGAQVGAFLYDAFIFTGEESIFNKPNAETRRHCLHARAAQRIPAPAGPNSVEIV